VDFNDISVIFLLATIASVCGREEQPLDGALKLFDLPRYFAQIGTPLSLNLLDLAHPLSMRINAFLPQQIHRAVGSAEPIHHHDMLPVGFVYCGTHLRNLIGLALHVLPRVGNLL
jgi:hypothetical protein